MFKKLVSTTGKEYGTLGESVGNGLYVGDIVSCYYDGRIITSVIVKPKNEEAFLMGLSGISVFELVGKFKAKKVVGYDLVNDELVNSSNYNLNIKKVDYVEMTQSDIEEILGYKVKIVSKTDDYNLF